jgi:hypothetical protein
MLIMFHWNFCHKTLELLAEIVVYLRLEIWRITKAIK